MSNNLENFKVELSVTLVSNLAVSQKYQPMINAAKTASEAFRPAIAAFVAERRQMQSDSADNGLAEHEAKCWAGEIAESNCIEIPPEFRVYK